KDEQTRITTGSVAKLGSISLLGQGAVDITPSTQGAPVPEWGYVTAGRTAASLGDVTDQAAQGVAEITKLVQDIRAGKGSIGKAMTDDQLYVELRGFVATAGEVMQDIRQGHGTLGRLLNDPKAAQSLEASLANLETLTA